MITTVKLGLRPVELTRMAGDVLTGSQQVSDGMLGAAGMLNPPRAASGNTAASEELSTAVQAVGEDAALALGRLVGVLEGDVDRLHRVAFALQVQDEINARTIRVVNPEGGPQAW